MSHESFLIGRLHPSNSGDWQVKDHERSWDEVTTERCIEIPLFFVWKKSLSQEQLKDIAYFPRFLSLVEVCGGKSTWKWPPWWTSKKEKEQKCHHYVCGGRVERKRRRGGQYSPNQMPSKLPWPWPIDLQWTCTMSTLKSCCVCCTAALLISIRALKHLTQMRICMASPLKVLCQNVKY